MGWLTGLRATPRDVMMLGLAGLVPFLLLAVAGRWLDEERATLALHGLIAYGAVILSFVGALQWAFVMQGPITDFDRSLHLFWSVCPALIGWVALQLSPRPAIALLMLGYAVQLVMDFFLARILKDWLQAYFVPLRVVLTLIVLALLWLGLPGFTLPPGP